MSETVLMNKKRRAIRRENTYGQLQHPDRNTPGRVQVSLVSGMQGSRHSFEPSGPNQHGNRAETHQYTRPKEVSCILDITSWIFLPRKSISRHWRVVPAFETRAERFLLRPTRSFQAKLCWCPKFRFSKERFHEKEKKEKKSING